MPEQVIPEELTPEQQIKVRQAAMKAKQIQVKALKAQIDALQTQVDDIMDANDLDVVKGPDYHSVRITRGSYIRHRMVAE